MRWLDKIDTMGFPFTLSIQGNKQFKTSLGGFFTIISVLFFLILFLLLGVNFYQRTNPTLSLNVSKPPEYFNYYLNSTSFIYAFRIENNDGELVIRPDLFYYEPRYIVYRREAKGLNKTVDRTLNFRQCEPEDVGNSSLWGELYLNRYMCIDYPKDLDSTGLPLGGMYDSNLIQYIKIRAMSCFKAPKAIQRHLRNSSPLAASN